MMTLAEQVAFWTAEGMRFEDLAESAVMYYNGPTDKPRQTRYYAKACGFYEKATEEENAEAMNRYALMLAEGRGVKKDMERAMTFFLKVCPPTVTVPAVCPPTGKYTQGAN